MRIHKIACKWHVDNMDESGIGRYRVWVMRELPRPPGTLEASSQRSYWNAAHGTRSTCFGFMEHLRFWEHRILCPFTFQTIHKWMHSACNEVHECNWSLQDWIYMNLHQSVVIMYLCLCDLGHVCLKMLQVTGRSRLHTSKGSRRSKKLFFCSRSDAEANLLGPFAIFYAARVQPVLWVLHRSARMSMLLHPTWSGTMRRTKTSAACNPKQIPHLPRVVPLGFICAIWVLVYNSV